jgi:phage terminase large subunit-like protein
MPRHFRIHPAFGTARMGNSPEHFIGPETPGVPGNSDDGVTFKAFRDTQGRVLRQGARFRVFEYDEIPGGALSNPREVTITGDIVDIEWRVHLSNRKASFFTFYGQKGADDFYQARSQMAANAPIKRDGDLPARANLRNPDVQADERPGRLDIDPGEKMISRSQGNPIELTNPNPNIPINSLGTLRLDDAGRLIVLGGYGQSASAKNPPQEIDEYANNDTWFDDASDGSVRARIRFADGTNIDADPSWVFVGPPKFAPGLRNVVSLLDTIWDTAVRDVDFLPSTPRSPMLSLLLEQKNAWRATGGVSLQGFKPSFSQDIYPIIKRALGARDTHESGTTANRHYHEVLLKDFAAMSALSGPRAQDGVILRQSIFAWIRNPNSAEVQWKEMPRGLGDDYTLLDAGAPTNRSFLSLTRIQYALLEQWAADSFIDDWSGIEPVFTPKQQPGPDDLDIAALENCVGGPFYPGIEVSWLIRTKQLFAEPFRLQVPKQPENPGQTAFSPLTVGALPFRPGFFSQQMALPWQADFYDCHKENWQDPDNNDYYFMWWTAQRPDDVYPSGQTERKRWVRAFDPPDKTVEDFEENDNARFHQMQTRWMELKFLTVRNGDHYEEES